MIIQGTVTDSQTGEPLPSASIYTVDYNLKQLGNGTTADADGHYMFNSAQLDDPNNSLAITSAGYQPLYQSISPAATTVDIALDRSGALSEVVISIKKKAKKIADHVAHNKTAYYVAGAIVLVGIGFFVFKRLKKHA